jgi:predicted nucleic acid-binding protein
MPDTDVLVDFLRGRPEALAFVDAHIDEIVLSPIVVAELYAGVRGEPELAVLDALVSGFPVASLTAEVAKAGGLYRRTYGKSHGVGLPDAILAALAQSERAELKTLNVKHYPMFSGLKPPYRKT